MRFAASLISGTKSPHHPRPRKSADIPRLARALLLLRPPHHALVSARTIKIVMPGRRPVDALVSERLTLSGAAPASRAGQISWALYEWARNPYYILVIIYVFGPYFVNVVVGDPVRGQEIWGYTTAISGIFLALTGPVLGAIADAGGARKPWLLVCTFL